MKKKKKKEIFIFKIDLKSDCTCKKKKIPSRQDIAELINKLKTYIP